MTDEVMRDLVGKHDAILAEYGATIKQLAISVEHSASQQVETNKQLREITVFLTEQKLITSRIETLDKELSESFKRVHKRIDIIENVQQTSDGCNSVKLLHKDVVSISRDVTRLVGTTEEHRLHIEKLDNHNAASISPVAIRWVVGLIVGYSVMFGTYVVQTFSQTSRINEKLATIVKRNSSDIHEAMAELKMILRKKD